MAYAGQVLENPVSGERITFVRTAADTGGELLAFELDLAPDGQVPGLHVHPRQEERFEVLDGRLRFRRGIETLVAEPGEVVVVPAGAAHKFVHAGDGRARVRVEVRPALRMEQLLETATALARAGRTNRRGMPRPLDLALFVREFRDEVRGPWTPGWLQRAALAPLAWLAQLRPDGGRLEPAAA